MGRLVAIVVLAIAPATASAGDEEARALFVSGTDALQRGRLTEARDLLRESMQHRAHPSTAFNLIVALRGTGEPLGALELCEPLLDGRFGAVTPARREQAAAVCREAGEDVAILEVEASGAHAIAVRIDGESAGEIAAGATLERRVDPGRHVIAVGARGHTGEERVVQVARGGRARVSMRVAPVAPEARAATGVDPLAWVLLAVASAAALAAVVAVAVVVSAGPSPVGSPDYPTVETLVESGLRF